MYKYIWSEKAWWGHCRLFSGWSIMPGCEPKPSEHMLITHMITMMKGFIISTIQQRANWLIHLINLRPSTWANHDEARRGWKREKKKTVGKSKYGQKIITNNLIPSVTNKARKCNFANFGHRVPHWLFSSDIASVTWSSSLQWSVH